MRVMIIFWLVLFSVMLKVQFDKKMDAHVCDSVVVTLPITDTITEYICMTQWGPHLCGFDPVEAALMMQAN